VGRIRRYYNFPLNEYFKGNPDRVIIPRGYNIEFVEVLFPDTVRVRIDDKIEKKLPVEPDIDLEPESGFVLFGPASVFPDSILFTGPKTVLQKMGKVPTEKLVRSGLSRPLEEEISLKLPETRLISVSHRSVKIYQDVQRIGEKQINGIPVTVVNVPSHLSIVIYPDTVSLTVEGGNDYIQTLKPSDITVLFDYWNQWIPKQRFFPLQIQIPQGVTGWKNLNPPRVEVVVVREK
jgi:YbbR domain-containing protein